MKPLVSRFSILPNKTGLTPLKADVWYASANTTTAITPIISILHGLFKPDRFRHATGQEFWTGAASVVGGATSILSGGFTPAVPVRYMLEPGRDLWNRTGETLTWMKENVHKAFTRPAPTFNTLPSGAWHPSLLREPVYRAPALLRRI
jgi:hypothetical protein